MGHSLNKGWVYLYIVICRLGRPSEVVQYRNIEGGTFRSVSKIQIDFD